MFKEFRAFVNQGNAMDLAVGVVIGAAFGKIVDSLVNDIIMPIIGMATGGLDFSQRYVPLHGQDPTLPLDAAIRLLDSPHAIPARGDSGDTDGFVVGKVNG